MTCDELRQFRKETEYYQENLDDLLKRYPDQWVAIFNQQVVGASPDARQLIADLQTTDTSLGETLFKFLTTKEDLWTFSVA